MARGESNLRTSTIEMLILYLLTKRDLYGYEMSFLLEQLSDGNYSVMESSLYPILYRLLDKKYISDRQITVGKRRTRVYYHLEPPGEVRLKHLLEDYRRTSHGIELILSSNLPIDINNPEN
ncbi:PadR family transcriptional regulator [Hornefia butyriciproducens]|uniref:PadR family transcriptional regulator n=1 Tax=Hornefia butyriciproducens TaxID=2652293 RepID=UPI003A93AA01